MASDSETFGMFEESIPLRKWEVTVNGKSAICREVLQASPWSSGPMLFYCLELEFPSGGKYKIMQWIEDPDFVDQMLDYESGRFWV